jgi:haloacetate dehalogenase
MPSSRLQNALHNGLMATPAHRRNTIMMDPATHAFLFPGFRQSLLTVCNADTGDVQIATTIGGPDNGPAVLLLHGHPQTRATWHRIAARLVAAGFRVVATDLRGYGDSSKPEGGERHINYSKRRMAADQIAVMRQFGIEKFAVVGHDRGGRVAHRLTLDFPKQVERVVMVDLMPTSVMYASTDKDFATRYFWWFFLIQPFDLPERMIGADPTYFLDRHINKGQVKLQGTIDPRVYAEYLRCYKLPGTIHSICEDYRAGASIDLEHDAADSSARIHVPLLALWGGRGTLGQYHDLIGSWHQKANDVRGASIDCGHLLQEELPDAMAAELLPFLLQARAP